MINKPEPVNVYIPVLKLILSVFTSFQFFSYY